MSKKIFDSSQYHDGITKIFKDSFGLSDREYFHGLPKHIGDISNIKGVLGQDSVPFLTKCEIVEIKDDFVEVKLPNNNKIRKINTAEFWFFNFENSDLVFDLLLNRINSERKKKTKPTLDVKNLYNLDKAEVIILIQSEVSVILKKVERLQRGIKNVSGRKVWELDAIDNRLSVEDKNSRIQAIENKANEDTKVLLEEIIKKEEEKKKLEEALVSFQNIYNKFFVKKK